MNSIALVLACAAGFSVFISAVYARAAQDESVWSGVYTEQQAERGKRIHAAACAPCHGLKLDGASDPDSLQSPPIARRPFIHKWEGKSIGDLFAFTQQAMPKANPGSLTDQQYIDAIAYMLKVSGMPSGDRELPLATDKLAGIIIRD